MLKVMVLIPWLFYIDVTNITYFRKEKLNEEEEDAECGGRAYATS